MESRAGVGTSLDKSTVKAAHQAASLAMMQAGISRADWGLVFATTHHAADYDGMLAEIANVLGTDRLCGCSAFGILSQDQEVERKPSIAVLAVGPSGLEFIPFLQRGLQESSAAAGRQIASRLPSAPAARDTSLLTIFPDPFSVNAAQLFGSIHDALPSVPLLGGLAAESGRGRKTYQFMGRQAVYDAVSGAWIGGSLRHHIGVTQSCQPITQPMRITRSDDAMVYELDGRPAFEVLMEVISALKVRDPRELAGYLFAGLPVYSYQNQFDRGSYIVCGLGGVDLGQGAVALAQPVVEGTFLTFTMRDPRWAEEDMVAMLTQVGEKPPLKPPLFGIYVNCCARGTALYGAPHHDITLIRNHLGDFPLIGFFSYGEIGPLGGMPCLNQYSGVLTLAWDS